MTGAALAREWRMKESWPKFPRNPLKSLDSDERIQGNPSPAARRP
jgi:hypothetical protein